MTANTDNAGAIAATLSAEEVKALKRLDNNAWCMPKNKSEAVAFRKFVELEWAHVDDFGHYRVTLAGREVLAVLAVASSEQPAEAGDSDMDALMGQIEAGYKSVNDRAAARGYIAALELQTRYEAAQAENADLRQQLADKEAECGRLRHLCGRAANMIEAFDLEDTRLQDELYKAAALASKPAEG